jgi:H/ACA ribonucleoprotein complex subunit 3
MRVQILRCINCGSYTLKETCPKCGSKTITTKPAKFSPEDKYGKYRRQLKIENEMGH